MTPVTTIGVAAQERRLATEKRERQRWRQFMQRFARNRLAVAGGFIIVLFCLAASFGPALAPYDFLEQDIPNALQRPSAQHWLGTDDLGRDIFSRLLYGARTAALVAFSTTLISVAIGVAVGTWAGLRGGYVDELLMWISEVMDAVPGLLLVILINTTLRRPLINAFDRLYDQTRNPFFLDTAWLDYAFVFSALALIGWSGLARLVRGQVMSISRQEFVLAARALGATDRYIMIHHVIPHTLGPLIVAVTAGIGSAIVLEAGLSFLGIGVQPPNPSWGTMLSDSLRLWQFFPHLLISPALTIAVIRLAFVFFGDGLNDALNPHITQARRRRRSE